MPIGGVDSYRVCRRTWWEQERDRMKSRRTLRRRARRAKRSGA